MKIALVHNPYYHQKHMENLKFVSNNFGVFPPLGIMYVSSVLKENGHETKILDVKAESLTREETIQKLRDFDPDFVGLMFIPFTMSISLEWAKEIKKELQVPIIAGNYAMVRYPEALLSNDCIDFGIIGSAVKALPTFLERWENEDDFEDIDGLALTKDGEVVINYPEKTREDLKELPWPDRDGINNSLYYSMASKKRPFTILTTSYGCTYKCDFCDMGKFGYSERGYEDVVDEIEHCVEEYGIEEIDIFDRDFLINRERAAKICREILDRNLDVQWSCRTRVDQVDGKILKLMNEAGCRLILYGIESGNQDILDREHKEITLEEIWRALELTKENDMETLGFFIIGHPGETEEEIKETIELSKKLPLDYAQFFKMTGKPGADLYNEIIEELGYDYFERLAKEEAEESDLPRPWTNLSNEEIEKWTRQAYREFYLRPSYIFKRLLDIEPLSELKKNIKVGLKLLSF